MGEKKPVWKSKTLGASALLPLLSLIPGVKDLVSAHPQESIGVISALFAVLRALTGKSIF